VRSYNKTISLSHAPIAGALQKPADLLLKIDIEQQEATQVPPAAGTQPFYSEYAINQRKVLRAESATTLKNSAEFLLNSREIIRCERELRDNHIVIRIVRLKPNGAGKLRAAGPLIEFAERHLPSLIATLQMLQAQEAE
jgi:hypothetical protein